MSDAITREPINIDYTMTSRDANELKGMVLLPFEFRQKLLAQYVKDRGVGALVDLFANFIGMASQVVENTREALFLFGLTELHLTHRASEDINVASLFGALQGVELANQVDQRKTCVGCAFRLGSLANQSPSTTSDAYWCVECDDDRFMCHEHMDENDQPTVPCGGYVQIQNRQRLATHPANQKD